VTYRVKRRIREGAKVTRGGKHLSRNNMGGKSVTSCFGYPQKCSSSLKTRGGGKGQGVLLEREKRKKKEKG